MTPVRSMAFAFDRRATLEPDAPALSFGPETWSYRQMRMRTAAMVAVLKAHGVTAGNRVGTLAGNHPDILVTLFAASAIGAVLVPLNIRLAPEEIAYIATDAELTVVVVDHVGAALIAPVRDAMGIGGWLLIDGSEPGWADLSAHLATTMPDFAINDGAADALAAIVYTSGTTGRPKGALLTNGNIWSNDLNWIFSSDIARSDVALVGAPLFHVGGLFVLTTATFLVGGHVILLPGFEAGAAIAAIERHRVTTTFGVPAMMLFISQHARFEEGDLSSLRLYIAGGAPVSESILRTYAARGIPVSQCYGLSEATSATVFLETSRAFEKLGSAGRAGMMAQIRLIDAVGRVIEVPGEKGEICVRGGNVSPGYWRNSEATANAIDADGWLRTGDVGLLDAEGFLTVCDRVKDMIISGGENVYPAEVESLLFDHPAIANVAVIGRADEKWGERVVAVAVLKRGEWLDLPGLQAFCDGRLARYKTPREFHVVNALPLNGAGKVLKTTLRTQLFGDRT
ncbi:MAG: acyl-CoA synthetase (AMP-forming)/AMP-acid ligase [Bradyrhizobium sp.]|nr:acyl-CoA synthetase (AMP-forming)/AMP-acid ligase [Bradyrhizobium sp.]